ncbi:alpha/beta fold hydrolase [Corynebacterium bovis]|uniref:alpha/beta fold hydrolase n=1 Tax=Corynebacterium bovis TaxID=36808 RepID=UPI00313A35BB
MTDREDTTGPVMTVTRVTLPDASVTPVQCFAPEDDATRTSRPLVMIWPGLGVGGRYYRPIARYLAERGMPVAIGELRGQGASTAVASRRHRWGYHHLASEDYPMEIRAAKAELGLPADHPTVLLTHSMGGQVGGIFLSRPEARELNVRGMMGVGTGTPWYRTFTGSARIKFLLGSQFMGAYSQITGRWTDGPLDVIGYGRQSGMHLAEWAKLARTNSLEGLHDADRNYVLAMRATTVPVLLTRFRNDEDCTWASAEKYGRLLPKTFARVEELDGDLGHNRWARDPQIVGDRLIRFCAQIDEGAAARERNGR